MPKAQITLTVEYEMDPNSYPEGLTLEEMLAVDLANAEDEPGFLLDTDDFQITGKILEES